MTELLKAPRGTTDILPPQTSKWFYVEGVMRSLADRYGYEEIRTPVFEQTSLFLRGIGEGSDIVSKQMYTFMDKGDRSLTLRPEFTAPAIRAYLEHQLFHQALVKWFYVGPGFRYERPQSGRFRQFHQFGVEAVGSMNPALDAEVIALAMEMFKQLELKNLGVKLNSIGCASCRPGHREALRNYFLPNLALMCEDCQTHRFEKNPLRILDCKVPECRKVIEAAPVPSATLCGECELHFNQVQHYLRLLNIPFSLDHHLVRGLEYYTKTVFEVVASSLGVQNSLCGGGRYDNLVESLGGPPRPAVGFAAGIERIILVMESSGSFFPRHGIDLFAIALGEQAGKVIFPIILELRRNGFRVRLDYQDRSLSSQLKEANRLGASWALIIGEDELSKNNAVLRNMQTHEQEFCPISELEKCLANKILDKTKNEAVMTGELHP